METKLYRKAVGLTPFAEVQVGSVTYTDSQIISLEINYGRSGLGLAPEVPTASIEVVGKHPLSYNQRVTIKLPKLEAKYPANDPEIRFIGRVGAQTWADQDNGRARTTIIATGDSIRLFRSEATFTFGPSNSLAHIVGKLSDELTRLKIPLPKIGFSGAMWTDRVNGELELSTGDILALLEKNSISVSHMRWGALVIEHPADRVDTVLNAVENKRPILRSEAISPAEHSQPISYIDKRVLVRYKAKGIAEPILDDWTRTYLPVGAEFPTDSTTIDMTELDYDNAENTRYWRYGIRAKVHQTMYLAWQTPSITVDLLHLYNGSSYDKETFRQLITAREGDIITFGGDWPGELQGPKVIQGYTETITQDGWGVKYSLGDPRFVFGYSSFWNPLPRTKAYTWNQAKGLSWNSQAGTTWNEAGNGIR